MPVYIVELPTGSARKAFVSIPGLTVSAGDLQTLDTLFDLHTTTTDGSGDAVSVVLGPSNQTNAWIVQDEGIATTVSSGEQKFRGGQAQLVIGSDGAGTVALLDTSAVGTQYVRGFAGDEGKTVRSVAISGGNVVLTFTPIGDPSLVTIFGVSGRITSAVAP